VRFLKKAVDTSYPPPLMAWLETQNANRQCGW
jgi:hypothetical protein